MWLQEAFSMLRPGQGRNTWLRYSRDFSPTDKNGPLNSLIIPHFSPFLFEHFPHKYAAGRFNNTGAPFRYWLQHFSAHELHFII